MAMFYRCAGARAIVACLSELAFDLDSPRGAGRGALLHVPVLRNTITGLQVGLDLELRRASDDTRQSLCSRVADGAAGMMSGSHAAGVR